MSTEENAIIATHWEGPLPPPNVVAEFTKVYPNAAEIIFKMAEQEQVDRLAKEHKQLDAARENMMQKHKDVALSLCPRICYNHRAFRRR